MGLFLTLSWLFFAPPTGALSLQPPQRLTYLGVGQDPQLFIWCLNWWWFSVAHHLPVFRTDYISWPTGIELVWRTSVPAPGLVLAPLVRRAGAVAVYNGLMLAAPGFAGWGAYIAARALVGRVLPAVLAGLVFGFSGYEMSESLGHLNLTFTVAVPLCVWACVAAARRRWPWPVLGVVLGLLLAMEFGFSQEVFGTTVLFGLFSYAGLFTGVPVLRPALQRITPGLVLGMVLATLIVSPFLWQMLAYYRVPDHLEPFSGQWCNDVLSFFIPTPVSLIGGRWFAPLTARFSSNYSEEGAYFGLPLLALLAWVYRARPGHLVRPLLMIALAAAVLSLGPYARFAGVAFSTAPWLPATKLPFLQAMLPGRFAMFAWLAIGLALAVWLAAAVDLRAAGRRYALALGALAFCIPSQAYVRVWTTIAIPAVFQPATQAASIKPGAKILILPYESNEAAYQYVSGMNFYLVGQGYLGGGIPAPFAQWPLILPLYDTDYARIDPHEFALFLAAYGADDVVLLNGMLPPGEAEALLARAGWQLGAAGLEFSVYRRGPAAPARADAAEVFAYMHAAQQRGRARRERLNVCAIERLERRFGFGRTAFLGLYQRLSSAPLPPASIDCPP